MKLITSKGQLAVPADFSFEMKKTNPFFSDEGEQSLPVTIPPSQDNIRTLGNPDRLGGSFANLRKTDARVECGIFHRSGKLIIESIGSDGIKAAIALSESDLYAKSKDKSIREIFSDVYRDDFQNSSTPIKDWAHYLSGCNLCVNDSPLIYIIMIKRGSEPYGPLQMFSQRNNPYCEMLRLCMTKVHKL